MKAVVHKGPRSVAVEEWDQRLNGWTKVLLHP
jgi:hypothetical protein